MVIFKSPVKGSGLVGAPEGSSMLDEENRGFGKQTMRGSHWDAPGQQPMKPIPYNSIYFDFEA